MSDFQPNLARENLFPEELALLEARAQVALAEARKANAEADAAESEAAAAALVLEDTLRKTQRVRWADPYQDHVFRFTKPVSDASVNECMNALNAWHREDPTCEMEVLFDSPGGSVVDGMHLFDHIIELRDLGHIVNTRTRGMAASMAGILLQAGDKRIMGQQASLMIHEASFGASGKIGEVEDTVLWVSKVQERILDIFAARCAESGAPKALTKRQLKTRWRRKNWWLDADEALAYGLIDEIS